MELQTVYIITKIEDELPKELDIVTLVSQVPFEHQFKVFDDGSKTMEFKFNGWLENGKYFIHGIGAEFKEGAITHWLKPVERFVFTPEQLEELLNGKL